MSTATTGKRMRAAGILAAVISVILLFSSTVLCYHATPYKTTAHPLYAPLTDELMDSELYEDMRSGKSFCFVGDSITYGSVTGGIGWYEPLHIYIKGKVMDYSFGGWTSVNLMMTRNSIPAADVYVFAIGINDVKTVDGDLYADTVEEFMDNLELVAQRLFEISPDAKMYFISPWPMIDHPEEVYARRDDFVAHMTDWCDGQTKIFIDPFDYIMNVIAEEGLETYMCDLFHPNGTRGVGLYSYAVLRQDHLRRTGEV